MDQTETRQYLQIVIDEFHQKNPWWKVKRVLILGRYHHVTETGKIIKAPEPLMSYDSLILYH